MFFGEKIPVFSTFGLSFRVTPRQVQTVEFSEMRTSLLHPYYHHVLVGGHACESKAAGEQQVSELPAQFMFPTSSPSRMPSLDLDIITIVTGDFFLFPTDTYLLHASSQTETHHKCRHHTMTSYTPLLRLRLTINVDITR
jgi:hypothetical protein